MKWNLHDWAIFDREIVQITEIRDSDSVTVSDGSFSTSGNLLPRLRKLSLRNKRIIEFFEFYYKDLRRIRGEGGFNYPDISRYFNDLTLSAIDDEANDRIYFDKARNFVKEANDYKPLIDNVQLFREGRS